MPENETLGDVQLRGRVLTVADCARLMGCSRAHISNLIRGKVPGVPPLPHARLGRKVVFKGEWIEEYLEQLRQ
jgi:excisionase family DNA binding protein